MKSAGQIFYESVYTEGLVRWDMLPPGERQFYEEQSQAMIW